jgi:hypothetical protein
VNRAIAHCIALHRVTVRPVIVMVSNSNSRATASCSRRSAAPYQIIRSCAQRIQRQPVRYATCRHDGCDRREFHRSVGVTRCVLRRNSSRDARATRPVTK